MESIFTVTPPIRSFNIIETCRRNFSTPLYNLSKNKIKAVVIFYEEIQSGLEKELVKKIAKISGKF